MYIFVYIYVLHQITSSALMLCSARQMNQVKLDVRRHDLTIPESSDGGGGVRRGGGRVGRLVSLSLPVLQENINTQGHKVLHTPGHLGAEISPTLDPSIPFLFTQ